MLGADLRNIAMPQERETMRHKKAPALHRGPGHRMHQ